MDAGTRTCWELMEDRGLYLSGHHDHSRDVQCIFDRPGTTEDHRSPRCIPAHIQHPLFPPSRFHFVIRVSEK